MSKFGRVMSGRGWWLLVGVFCLLAAHGPASAADLLPPGFRPLPPSVHALVGGTVVVNPEQKIENGTVVIRNGLITQVGAGLTPPADARIWDMKGLIIYAGFIDPYLVLGGTNAPVSTSDSEPVTSHSLTAGDGGANFFGVTGQRTDRGNPGPGYGVSRVTPEFRAVLEYSPKETVLEPLREAGFTAGIVAPSKGIIRGTSALIQLADENPNQLVLKSDVFQHIAFESPSGEERGYPGSLMGTIAVVRQSFFDAHHYALDRADYRAHQTDRKPVEFDPALEALQAAADKKIMVAFEPGSALMISRAAVVARELGLEFCLVSSGQEWRRPDLAKATAATFIVPLNFPTLPKPPTDADWDQVRLDQLRAWDWAPENPTVLRKQGLELALTTYGLSDKKKFRSNLRVALDRGLPENDALAGLTTIPAKLSGVADRLGTIEAGKIANLTVVEGAGYFQPDAKVREVWIGGRVYLPPAEEPKSEKADQAKAATKSTSPEETKPPKAKEEPEKKASSPKPETPKAPPKTEVTSAGEDKEKSTDEKSSAEKKDKKKDQSRELQRTRTARAPLDDRGPLTNPPSILIRNATIWTSGNAGVLSNASLLISNGKVQQVGSFKADPGPDTLVIDGAGLHVSPGLIDCHSHTAILGSVNESSLPSTAMVRIRDVVNSETDNIYEQLAGGVTAVNLLHGSANPIGGQNCVIKFRLGEGPDDLVFKDAPQGIKFALGENVKQSNWGDRFTTRFPQSRMGVRTFFANRFTAAQEYLAEWAKYNAGGSGAPRVPPARDLELEAIGEIIQGKRLIHCHSYRQDEILMLIRLMESFNVKIGTFQHVLEGYKVADEIAQHGAGGSTFSDWWAYKFEVYDAIPYNGSLMHDRGVVVSFNSDSSELARRLYTEAAKAVKYGGTPETEALKFVTLNPAKQLRIDNRVGSLEPGKDADFAIWSKSPLDSGTVCLQTWVDGKKYFDRSLDAERTARLKKERADLIAKAKKVSGGPGGKSDGGGSDGEAFFRLSLEHQYDDIDRDCLDEEREGK
jgi:imidazolonepropionase-like amidohydrolase